jgi:hypothetical protein
MGIHSSYTKISCYGNPQDVGMGQKRPCQHLGPDFRQLSTLKKQHLSLRIFGEKNVLYQKGDEITRFDGTLSNPTAGR